MINAHSIRIKFTFCFMLLISPLSSFAGLTEGIQFLRNQFQAEGSYSGGLDIATRYQSTAEVLDSFYILDESQQTDSSAALQFLQNEPCQGIEYLSRLIIVKAEQGQVDSNLISQLQSYQNQDGGFGELPGHQATVLDTSFALTALQAVNQLNHQSALNAMRYLLTHLNSYNKCIAPVCNG